MRQETRSLIHLSSFGLTRNPFAVTPDPRFFMRSRTHLDALASLIYGIRERKGFITVTGHVGTGKTTLLNTLLSNIDLDVHFSHIIYSDLSFFELLQMICADFGMAVRRQTKVELMNELFDFLVDKRLRGHNALVVIDEAQNLSPEVMESLRMLSNFETSREKLLQIVLCGQPELKKLLSRPELRQLAQRIVVNTEIKPLTAKESVSYMYHRLKVAGAEGERVFPQEIVGRIAELSGGIPRIINILCDNCLTGAFAEESPRVTESILAEAERQYFSMYDKDLGEAVSDVVAAENSRGSISGTVTPLQRHTPVEMPNRKKFELDPEEEQEGKPRRKWFGFRRIAAFCLVILLGVFVWVIMSNQADFKSLAGDQAETSPLSGSEDTDEVVLSDYNDGAVSTPGN